MGREVGRMSQNGDMVSPFPQDQMQGKQVASQHQLPAGVERCKCKLEVIGRDGIFCAE